MMRRSPLPAATLIALSMLAACTGSKLDALGGSEKKNKGQSLDGGRAMLAGQSPNPAEVVVRGVTYAGTGCPADSVATNLSPDAKALTLIFSQFSAVLSDPFTTVVGPGSSPADARRNCQINLDLQAPTGYAYSLFTLDTRGYASLDAGVTGTVRSSFYFQAAAQNQVFEEILRGPTSGDFHLRAEAGVETDVPQDYLWSSCEGASRSLNINTEIALDNRGADGAEGLLTVDSIDGELRHVYGLRWRKCEEQPTPPSVPPPPPVDSGTSLTIFTTIAELRMRHPGCSGPYTESLDMSCRAATRRLCAEHGYPGGMMVEYDSANSAQVVCLKGELKLPAVSELTSHHASCSGQYGPQFILACDSAATSLCGPTFAAAFLQEYNGVTNQAGVICVSKEGAASAYPSIGTLAQHHASCSGPWNPGFSPIACNAAFSRYCRSLGQGFKSGFIANYDSADAAGGACVK